MCKRIENYDIPKLEQSLDDGIISECREICEEKSIIVSPEDLDTQIKLNPEQQQVFKIISERIESGQSGLFFVDGPGGTEKTFLYTALLANIRSRGMIALATTTSGVAATLLSGCRTTHSRFEILLQTTNATVTHMSKQSSGAKLIRKAKLIIWDEAPMASRRTIKTVGRIFRDILDINAPFGGKVMVSEEIFIKYLQINLTRNMRARADPSFSEFLLRIGNREEPTIKDNLIDFTKNVPIMLLRNLDASNGLCNSTRMICRGFDKNIIHAEIMIGKNAFKHVFIPRIQLSPPEIEGLASSLASPSSPLLYSAPDTYGRLEDSPSSLVEICIQRQLNYKLKAFFEGQEFHEVVGGMSEAPAKPYHPVSPTIPDDPSYPSPTWVSNIGPIYIEFVGIQGGGQPFDGDAGFGKMVAKGLGNIAPKKDVVLIFLINVTAMEGGVNVQTSFAKIGISGKVAMVHEPHEGLDLVRDSKLPNPVVGLMCINEVSFEAVDVVVGTFTRKSVISSKSPQRGVLFQNRGEGGKDTREDGLDDFLGEIKEDKDLYNKRPLQSIKNFFQVNFEEHVSLLTLHLGKVTNIFLDNNVIVRGPSVGHETGLARDNDLFQERLQPGGYDLSDEPIRDIKKAYGSKVLKRSGIPTFWDEAQIVKGVDSTLSRRVELGSNVPQNVFSSVEVGIMGKHYVNNVSMVVMPSATVINEEVDFVSSPPIEGGGMEESGVRVLFKKPRDSVLKFPELSLQGEDMVELF
ncbi:hypothetical protein BC332_10857 [Capsicum chinense]|nr:hypothetical protein BC332_10857 [Capsicum chinense]